MWKDKVQRKVLIELVEGMWWRRVAECADTNENNIELTLEKPPPCSYNPDEVCRRVWKGDMWKDDV